MTNKQVKEALLIKYGSYCMLCGRKLKKDERTLHHIMPVANGGDTNLENGSILCRPCQNIIHTFYYEDEAYKKLTKKIMKNKREK